MANPDTAHGFVYIEEGYVDIAASPYFTPTAGVDYTVNGYIEQIRYTLVGSLEVHLGVFPRSGPAADDFPLHSSYIALQTLYRQRTPSVPSSSTAGSSGIQSTATADVIPVPSAGNPPVFRYWRAICLTVALAIVCRLVLLLV